MLYLIGFFFVFIFGYHDNFIDLTITKRTLFINGSLIFVALMLASTVFHIVYSLIKKKPIIRKQPALFFILGLIVIWGIGYFFAIDTEDTFLGLGMKCTGLLVYLLGAIIILFFGFFLKWNRLLTLFFLISAFGISLLQVLNRFEIDPLYMYTNLIWYEHPQFIATFGNTNYNGALNCLIIGILMTLFFKCENIKSLFVYGSVLLFAFAGGICCASNVVFVCIAITMVILAGFACLQPSRWFRIWEIMILFTIPCGFFYFYYKQLDEELFIWDLMEKIFKGTYLKYQVAAVIAFGILIAVLYKFMNKHKNGFFLAYKILVSVLIFTGVSAVIIANSDLDFVKNVSILGKLKIEGSWGNDRGDLWQRCMSAFIHAPIENKLFGFGFNNIYQALETIGLGVRTVNDTTEMIVDAHSIYFNTLLTSGILGVVAWGGFLVYLFIQTAKSITEKKSTGIVTLVGLVSILVQGLVVGPQIFTTPVILIEFGIFSALLANQRAFSSPSAT